MTDCGRSKEMDQKMITGEQLRAARAMLRMEQVTLAEKTGVSVETIRRLESLEGELSGRDGTLVSIINVLRLAGIEFIQDDGTDGRSGSGVRFATDEISNAYRKRIAIDVRDLVDEILIAAQKEEPNFYGMGADHISKVLSKKLPAKIKEVIPSTMQEIAVRTRT